MRLGPLVAACVLAVGGCSVGGDGPDDDEPSESPETTDITLPSEVDARVDESARYDERFLEKPAVLKRGHGLRTVAVLDDKLDDGSPWRPIAATPGGQLISAAPSVDGEGVFLIDPETGTQTTLLANHRWTVFAADANRRWVVWVMSGARDLFTMPWELWSYDRKSGNVRKVAVAPDVGVDPVPAAPDGTVPTLHKGTVYLGAVEEVPERGQPEPAIYRVPADGSKPLHKMIDHAYRPVVRGDALYYTVGPGGSFRTWDLRQRDLDSGNDESVESAKGGPRLAGVEAGSAGVMWEERAKGRCLIKLADDADTKPEVLVSARCGRYPRAYGQGTDRYFAFSYGRTSGYVTYVYDEDHERLAKLDDVRGTAAKGYGNLIVWEPTAGPDKGKVVVARLTDDRPAGPEDSG